MRARSRSRLGLRPLPWVTPLAAGAVGALVAASCTASRGSIGDDCLKDEDCISGVCAELTCAASPTYLDGEANLETDAEASADGEETADVAATDVAVEAAPDVTLETPEAAVDTGVVEGGSSEGSMTPIADAGGEASVDAGQSATPDGGTTTGAVDASSAPDASIDASPAASPDASPDASSDASPAASSDASPDASSDAHLDGASE
jgi:hypothetical protein